MSKRKTDPKIPVERIDVTDEQISAFEARARERLSPEDFELVENLVKTIRFLQEMVGQKSTSIARLLKVIFGSNSERLDRILEKTNESLQEGSDENSVNSACADNGDDATGESPSNEASGGATSGQDAEAPAEETSKRGHGRRGAADYPDAERHKVECSELHSGDLCPECGRGKVYELSQPAVVVRFTGAPPVQAVIWELQRLRCNLCGTVFRANPPPEAQGPKYDETVGAVFALLKYGNGMPFYRLDKMQASLGHALPASTQWEIVEQQADRIYPAFEELKRQAAQGGVLHNDDTTQIVVDSWPMRMHNVQATLTALNLRFRK